MNARLLARTAFWLGLATLAILIGFRITHTLLAGGCGHQSDLFVFQLAGHDGAAHVLTANVTRTGSCVARNLEALNVINLVDVAFFIPIYVVFLTLSALLLSGRWNGPVTLIAIAAAFVAGAADVFETVRQLQVSRALLADADYESVRGLMNEVQGAARAKYAALSLNAAALALIAFLQKPPLRFIGAIALLPVMGASAIVADPDGRWWMMAACFGAAWITLIFYALRKARAKDAPPPAPAA